MTSYRIKNWSKFQHYKDRNPPWIKLHADLLTSEPWMMAPTDADRLLLIVLMQLAARNDNVISGNPAYIAKFAHLDNLPSLEWVLEVGFIEPCEESATWKAPWPSRYIAPAVKQAVLERDKNRCVTCAATANLELDHIIPVSKGGTSQEDNLQVLCRSCNRRKRTRVADATQCVASATQDENLRSPETETETEAETERNILIEPEGFEQFWNLYPSKVGKAPARKAYIRALKKTDPEKLLDGVRYYLTTKTVKDGFVAHAATWLNQERWNDEPAPIQPATIENTDERGWQNRLRAYREQNLWSQKWGPQPGAPGCAVPRDLLGRAA